MSAFTGPDTQPRENSNESTRAQFGDAELRSLGVVRCHVGSKVDLSGWAEELSQVSPQSVFAEDGEYAQYRNIKEDSSFPFDAVFAAISPCLIEHFVENPDEVVLDDAFAIHYNESHWDTRVARHTDPSDITVNLCLERSEDLEGSQVQFFGESEVKNPLSSTDRFDESNVTGSSSVQSSPEMTGSRAKVDHSRKELDVVADESAQQPEGNQPLPKRDKTFLVNPETGWATMHWGKHPHLVTSLSKGSRTNVVLTYVYADKSRTRLGKEDCFLDETLLKR